MYKDPHQPLPEHKSSVLDSISLKNMPTNVIVAKMMLNGKKIQYFARCVVGK